MKIWRNSVALLCGFALTGCTALGVRSRIANYGANTPEMSRFDVKRFVADQDAIVGEFALMAGVSVPGPTGEWRPIIDAGIHYADVRCDRFMDSLFWFNRVRETTSRQIQYTGAAVSAALAIVQASVNAIGLTPLGFNFLDQTVNNFGQGLLFNLNPSNVRTIVERKQTAYRQGLTASYNSRALAMQVIQDYAAICLPASIETEVELAISTQEYKAQPLAPPLPPASNDRTPDPFGFEETTSAALTPTESEWVQLTGTGASTSISISAGGAYEIRNGGRDSGWRTAQGSIPPNALYRVKVTSPATPGDSVRTTLTIGGVPGTFTVTTAPDAAMPAPVTAGETPTPVEAPALGDNAAPAPEGEGEALADAKAEGDEPLPEPEPVTTTPQQNGVPNPQPQG